MSDIDKNIRAKNGEWKFSGDVSLDDMQKSVPLIKMDIIILI